MNGPNRPTIGEQIAHADWVEQAVKLALKHWSARRIAAKLGLHHSTVSDALKKELSSRRLDDAQIEAYRNIQRETVLRLLTTWEPKARAGDKDAALVHLRYLERWAKLDGLDAPARAEVTGHDGAPIMLDTTGLTLEQMRAIVADTEPRAEGGGEEAALGGHCPPGSSDGEPADDH